MIAPLSSSHLTAFVCPFAAAQCSADWPSPVPRKWMIVSLTKNIAAKSSTRPPMAASRNSLPLVGFAVQNCTPAPVATLPKATPGDSAGLAVPLLLPIMEMVFFVTLFSST
eukprot:jgi/Chrpa1/13059/Chrysochromulina_OHIO_Genome00004434-RA